MKYFLLVPLLLSQPLMAATTTRCPPDYSTAKLSAKGVPAPPGWKGIAHIPGPRMVLQSAGVIAGSPLGYGQGVQVGEETKTKTGYRVKFSYLDKFTEPQEIWIYCAYGIGSDVQLLQRLPDGTSSCIAEYIGNDANGYNIKIECQ